MNDFYPIMKDPLPRALLDRLFQKSLLCGETGFLCEKESWGKKEEKDNEACPHGEPADFRLNHNFSIGVSPSAVQERIQSVSASLVRARTNLS